MAFTTKANYWKKRAFDQLRTSVNQLGVGLREVKHRLNWGGWDTTDIDQTIKEVQSNLEKLVDEIENVKEKSEDGQMELPFDEESTTEAKLSTKDETESTEKEKEEK